MKNLLILGGLGAASSLAMMVIDARKRGQNEWNFCGYINDKDGVKSIQGYPVLGGKEDIQKFLDQDYYFLNTIYKIDGMLERVEYVAENAKISPGCIVMPHASVSSNAHLGKFCRLSVSTVLGHDTVLGDHTFLAAGSVVGSHNNVGKAVYFGLNCTSIGKLNIGSYSVLGMGSVLTKDTGKFEIWTGNPARFKRKTNDSIIR
jgi:acetyltransferase EpsM